MDQNFSFFLSTLSYVVCGGWGTIPIFAFFSGIFHTNWKAPLTMVSLSVCFSVHITKLGKEARMAWSRLKLAKRAESWWVKKQQKIRGKVQRKEQKSEKRANLWPLPQRVFLCSGNKQSSGLSNPSQDLGEAVGVHLMTLAEKHHSGSCLHRSNGQQQRRKVKLTPK